MVVTDGFTGNVALKTMEGFLVVSARQPARSVTAGNWRTRLAYLLVRKNLNRYARAARSVGIRRRTVARSERRVDHRARIVESARRFAMRFARRRTKQLVHHVNAEIVAVLARVPQASVPEKPGGKGIRGLFERMRERLHRHREPGDRKGDRAERGEGSGRKTGPLAALEHGEDHNRVDVVLHPEAVIEQHVYGVNHRVEGPSNGVVKAAGEPHEAAADVVVSNPAGPQGVVDAANIKKS